MRKWTTPFAVEENIAANVSVAETVCYKLGCNNSAANAYEEAHKQWFNHQLIAPPHGMNGCGNADKQVITVDTSTNTITGMKEIYNGDGDGNTYIYPCSFYDSEFNTVIKTMSCTPGKIVYWQTEDKSGRKYHHQGTITLNYASHPLRS